MIYVLAQNIIIRVIRQGVRWAGHVASMGDTRNSQGIDSE
jgi:hypothetical protein